MALRHFLDVLTVSRSPSVGKFLASPYRLSDAISGEIRKSYPSAG